MITNQEKREGQLALSLWEQGKGDVLRGVTAGDEVKRRIRAVILQNRMGSAIVGQKDDGATVTFAEAFHETYGEPLIPQTAAISRENVLKAAEAMRLAAQLENQTEQTA